MNNKKNTIRNNRALIFAGRNKITNISIRYCGYSDYIEMGAGVEIPFRKE